MGPKRITRASATKQDQKVPAFSDDWRTRVIPSLCAPLSPNTHVRRMARPAKPLARHARSFTPAALSKAGTLVRPRTDRSWFVRSPTADHCFSGAICFTLFYTIARVFRAGTVLVMSHCYPYHALPPDGLGGSLAGALAPSSHLTRDMSAIGAASLCEAPGLPSGKERDTGCGPGDLASWRRR